MIWSQYCKFLSDLYPVYISTNEGDNNNTVGLKVASEITQLYAVLCENGLNSYSSMIIK